MQQDVLGFDIPVDDVAVVHELDCVAHLPHHVLNSFLLEAALLSQGGVHVSTAAGLQDEVEMVIVAETGVQLHDVWVVQVALDLYFPHQLVDEPGLPFENAFRDFLEGTDEVGPTVTT